jgi:hypothetical protein
LVEGDTNGHVDFFVHDRVTGETSALEPIGFNEETHVSADGRCETFAHSNIGESYPNGVSDVFVRCLGTSK